MDSLVEVLQQGETTTATASELFDSLDPVDLDFMWGRWRGYGLHTGHAMDGLLEVASWYGKEFVSPDEVHPLLFSDAQGQLFKVEPKAWMMEQALKMPIPKNEAMTPVYRFLGSFLKTDASQARLRMMEHRGKVSATMIYDRLPIHDSFRKVDDDTLLGWMDYKASDQPFFFLLKRASQLHG